MQIHAQPRHELSWCKEPPASVLLLVALDVTAMIHGRCAAVTGWATEELEFFKVELPHGICAKTADMQAVVQHIRTVSNAEVYVIEAPENGNKIVQHNGSANLEAQQHV